MRTSIISRIFGVLAAMAAILTAFIILAAGYMASSLETDIGTRNLILAKAVGRDVQTILEKPASHLRGTVHILESQNPLMEARELTSYMYLSGIFQRLELLDRDGITQLTSPPDPEALGIDHSHQPFFRAALETEDVIWSDVQLDVTTRMPSITLALGFSKGVLLGHIDLRDIMDITRHNTGDSQMFIAVVDRRGVIVGHPDAVQVMRVLSTRDMTSVRHGLSGEGGTFRDAFQGIEGLASVSPIPRSGWVVLVFQPLDQALHMVNDLRTTLLAAGFILLALLGATLMMLRKNLARNLGNLDSQAKAIAGGNYGVRMLPEYSDFTSLAESFNIMAKRVSDREQSLRDHLEVNSQIASASSMLLVLPDYDEMARITLSSAIRATGAQFGVAVFPISENETGVFFVGPQGLLKCVDRERALEQLAHIRETTAQTDDPVAGSDGPIIELAGSLRTPGNYLVTQMHTKTESIGFIGILGAHAVDKSPAHALQRLAVVLSTTILRKQQKIALLEAMRNAEQASRAKNTFLANMSHELRTPLNGALGMLQLLNGTRLSKNQKEFVGTAINSCQNLTRLLGDLLDLSRVEAGKLSMVKEPFTLRDLMVSVTTTFQAKAQDKGLTLEYIAPPNLPATCEGDPDRIRQILFNLVSNAIKYTEHGGVRLELTPLPHAPPGMTNLLFSVQDTGIGIPDDMHDLVFEAFEQTDPSSTRSYQGAGLGLSIVKHLVQLLGGTLSLISEEDKGTLVMFTIPLGTVHEEDGLTDTQSETDPPDITGLRFLVAEDEVVNRTFLIRVLEQHGARAEAAKDGRQALNLLEKRDYDCVLMDIQMPYLDGLDVVRELRNAPHLRDKAHTPVIALTAYAMDGDRKRLLASGMDGYVSKPVPVDRLLQEVRKVLPQAN